MVNYAPLFLAFIHLQWCIQALCKHNILPLKTTTTYQTGLVKITTSKQGPGTSLNQCRYKCPFVTQAVDIKQFQPLFVCCLSLLHSFSLSFLHPTDRTLLGLLGLEKSHRQQSLSIKLKRHFSNWLGRRLSHLGLIAAEECRSGDRELGREVKRQASELYPLV